MKFIDDKGKLLGIINYIDLAIFLVIISLVVGFMFLRNNDGIDNEYENLIEEEKEQDITIEYFVKGVKDISVESVEVGDLFKNANTGKVLGKVINKKVEQATMTTTDEKGNVIESEIPDRYNITLTIESSGTVSDEAIKANGEVIYIGQSTPMQSKMIRFLAVIYGIKY